MEYNKIDQFIGDKIKDARLLKRMSQKDLADYVSIRLKNQYRYIIIVVYICSNYNRNNIKLFWR